MDKQVVKYSDYTDEQLLQIKDESNGAGITDFLLEKYKPLVRKISNRFYLIGAETDDVIQEGMIGLFKAIGSYESGKDASFYTFAHICIERQMMTALAASNRKKHAPLNSYISMSNAGEQLVDEMIDGPETLVIEQEFWEEFFSELWEKLSKMEQQVLALYREGKTYTEIADIMDKEPKAIDNALQRIRKKVSLWNFQESGKIPSVAL